MAQPTVRAVFHRVVARSHERPEIGSARLAAAVRSMAVGPLELAVSSWVGFLGETDDSLSAQQPHRDRRIGSGSAQQVFNAANLRRYVMGVHGRAVNFLCHWKIRPQTGWRRVCSA
jgi:hypothetical protein